MDPRAAGSGVWAPRACPSARPRRSGMEREPGLRGERARKPPLSVAGVGASPQVRGRSGGGAGGEKGLAFSLSLFLQFAALRSCLVAAAFQIEIDSSEQGGGVPKRCCAVVVVVHLRGLVGGFVIFILVPR